MKLKINNYKNIIGQYGNHVITNVVELPEYYSFTVRRDTTASWKDVFVKRDGRIDADGDWIYHFGHGSYNTQSVTPGWFGNMANAVTAIISEYETL